MSAAARNTKNIYMDFNKLKKIAKILLLISLMVFGISYFLKNSLPTKNKILNSSLQEPVQNEKTGAPFTIKKGGISYKVEPKFSYEIHGLVVAQYNSENWMDVFHKDDHLNTRDLCLLWGDNVKTDIFHKFKYSHGEFTCFLKYNGSDQEYLPDQNKFSWSQISNNHLLPANNEMYNKIKNADIGDQVYFKGYLADYSYDSGKGEWKRVSSLTRGDTGNGACEIVYITDFQITKKGNVIYHLLFEISKYLIVICLIFLFVSILRNPIRPGGPPAMKTKFPSIFPTKINTKY